MLSSYSTTSLPTANQFRAALGKCGSIALGLTIALVLAVPSTAAIADFSGDLVVIDPPDAVTLSSLEDDFLAKLFVEQQSVLLDEELLVDVSVPGVVSRSSDLSPTTFVDVVVNSYLVHADPIRYGYPPRDYAGSITFEEEILGIMVTGGSLDGSDLLLGSAVTRYIPPDYYRGFEGPGFRTQGFEINDSVELMADLRTVTFHFMTTSQLDQMRIVTSAAAVETTAAAPEPSTVVLLLAGFLLSRDFRRRRMN